MLTIKTPERTYFTPCSSVSIVNFEQVNAGWDRMILPNIDINLSIAPLLVRLKYS